MSALDNISPSSGFMPSTAKLIGFNNQLSLIIYDKKKIYQVKTLFYVIFPIIYFIYLVFPIINDKKSGNGRERCAFNRKDAKVLGV